MDVFIGLIVNRCRTIGIHFLERLVQMQVSMETSGCLLFLCELQNFSDIGSTRRVVELENVYALFGVVTKQSGFEVFA